MAKRTAKTDTAQPETPESQIEIAFLDESQVEAVVQYRMTRQENDMLRKQNAKLTKALEDLVAADNCNYDRDTMRTEGFFDNARKALGGKWLEKKYESLPVGFTELLAELKRTADWLGICLTIPGTGERLMKDWRGPHEHLASMKAIIAKATQSQEG